MASEIPNTDDSQDPGLTSEITTTITKQGTPLPGDFAEIIDDYAAALNDAPCRPSPAGCCALQTFVSKYINMRFEPFGMTDDPDLPMAVSVLDYLFRRLALDFLDADTRSQLNMYSLEDEVRQLTEAGSLR